jgi:hypothetical protein
MEETPAEEALLSSPTSPTSSSGKLLGVRLTCVTDSCRKRPLDIQINQTQARIVLGGSSRTDESISRLRGRQKSFCFLYPEGSDVNAGTLFLTVLQNQGKDAILTKISSAESTKTKGGETEEAPKEVGAPATGELNWHVPFFLPFPPTMTGIQSLVQQPSFSVPT